MRKKRSVKKRSLTASLVHGKNEISLHRYASTPKMRKQNLELLFQLQRMAYPELDKGIQMNRRKVKLSRT